MRPKQRAILAKAPTFVRHAALVARDLQILPRLVRQNRLGWIEMGKMFSQNLVSLVTLDSLGTDVPARHEAFRVEHHEGVLGDAIDQQPKALLAFSKIGFVAASLGEIPGDL